MTFVNPLAFISVATVVVSLLKLLAGTNALRWMDKFALGILIPIVSFISAWDAYIYTILASLWIGFKFGWNKWATPIVAIILFAIFKFGLNM